ncbi:MAG: quinone-dependent dihydroorotate dehydrogenase [Rikenellaceae bacterium]
MGLYRSVIKPILFNINIERAHSLALILLRISKKLPFAKSIIRSSYSVEHPSLERLVFGRRFKNPIGVAPGFDINGEVIGELENIGFGFVEIGAITPEQQSGNPKPRVFRLKKDNAIIHRLGQPNKGLYSAINNLRKNNGEVMVGCNIARNSNTLHTNASKEYLKSFRNLYQYVDYFTLSINYDHLVTNEETTVAMALEQLVSPLFDFRRGQTEYRPIMIKISADMSDEMIDTVTDVMIATPLDGIVAIDGTTSRPQNLNTTERNVASIGTGRLSGEPIRERALEVVKRVHHRSGGAYPIIGVGGIMNGEDAKAMLEAGASLVQVMTGFIYGGPGFAGQICKELIVKEEVETPEKTNTENESSDSNDRG